MTSATDVAAPSPTPRQLALAAGMLDRDGCANAPDDEHYKAATVTVAWLQRAASQTPRETITRTASRPSGCEGNQRDSSGNASKAAAISAKAAARDAIAAGADPLIVVDAALPQIARFRELAGVSAKYVAQDPLAALVVELRHKRVPPPFARVVRALALATGDYAVQDEGYDDGHDRPEWDWSLLRLLALVDLATFEGPPERLAEKAIHEAGFFAHTLPQWHAAICEEMDGMVDYDDPEVRADIERAGDQFIATLSQTLGSSLESG